MQGMSPAHSTSRRTKVYSQMFDYGIKVSNELKQSGDDPALEAKMNTAFEKLNRVQAEFEAHKNQFDAKFDEFDKYSKNSRAPLTDEPALELLCSIAVSDRLECTAVTKYMPLLQSNSMTSCIST